MKNSKALFHELLSAIKAGHDKDETRAIAYVVMTKLFGVTRSDIMAEKFVEPKPECPSIEEVVERLNRLEPVQYILGEAPFYGRTFQVTHDVLIPRPETEELVRVIVEQVGDSSDLLNIIDIGTGSGCIAITLALEIPRARVYATDVSEAALRVASSNAQTLSAVVSFQKHNILLDEITAIELDVIVSNPPYIARSERQSMLPTVYEFEPTSALFVDDDEPLLFYKSITRKAVSVLKPGGLLAFEINERFGKEVAALFLANQFYDVLIIRDLFGKERVVTGRKN